MFDVFLTIFMTPECIKGGFSREAISFLKKNMPKQTSLPNLMSLSGVGYIWAPPCGRWTYGRQTLRRLDYWAPEYCRVFNFVFLQLRCFCSYRFALNGIQGIACFIDFLHNSKRRPNGTAPSCLASNRRRPNGGVQMGLPNIISEIVCQNKHRIRCLYQRCKCLAHFRP